MKNEMELHQVVCNVLITQIKFGAYRFGERLPSLEEASQCFLVSLDTVRSAYLRMRHEGFITLSKNVGATVKVQYREEEIQYYIEEFFSSRKDALLDLSQSMLPLFSHAHWAGLKAASPESLDEIERLAKQTEILPSYQMIRFLQYVFTPLNNDLLMRLVWQVFMFFQAPFLSVPDQLRSFEVSADPLLKMVALCRKKDWSALRTAVDIFQEGLFHALSRFYGQNINVKASNQKVSFSWNTYKKSSQLCYDVGMEFLTAISRGNYPAGSYLPSLKDLAKEKNVSVSTIRRMLSLLNSIGIVKSINGIGTQVVSLSDSTNNCDFSQPNVIKRLLDFAESLQLLAFSCKAACEITITSLSADAVSQFKDRLCRLKQKNRYELLVYTSFETIADLTALEAVTIVYKELISLLFWGHPLRNMHGDQETINAFYLPYLDYMINCLDCADASGFAAKLEELLFYEVDFTIKRLTEVGIQDAAALACPGTIQCK